MFATDARLSPRLRRSRRPRLSSPRAWFPYRPQVQALVYHPKVQWAMTNLGIRRWLTIRRWPALFLASASGRAILDLIHGPRWQQDLAGAASALAFFVTALTVDAYLSGWTGLLTLGRALTWGRLRRLCRVYPPHGQPSWHTRTLPAAPPSANPPIP